MTFVRIPIQRQCLSSLLRQYPCGKSSRLHPIVCLSYNQPARSMTPLGNSAIISSPYSTTKQTSSAADTQRHHDDEAVVVYESPFGNLVSRLRFVSLLTGVAGSVGLPIVVALKGTVPSAGFLALCLSFGTGTLASTAAIHYVFSPYVFYIERIPVRRCHYPKETEKEEDGNSTRTPKTPASQAYLYKAITKSLFLTRIETVFDPATEVAKYTGFTLPLCNLVVRDKTHLFVHSESVYDNTLQRVLPLGKDGEPAAGRTTAQGKPAREKAVDEDEQYFF